MQWNFTNGWSDDANGLSCFILFLMSNNHLILLKFFPLWIGMKVLRSSLLIAWA
jgi:hypothetical protein